MRVTARLVSATFATLLLWGSHTTFAAETWIKCESVQVVAYEVRVHVKCAAATEGVFYFAASTDNHDNADRMLHVMTAAHLSDHTLSILYDPERTDDLPNGCRAEDCRKLLAIGMEKKTEYPYPGESAHPSPR